MSWSKFSRMGQAGTSSSEIGLRGPIAIRHTIPAATETQVANINYRDPGLESLSGKPEKMPKEAEQFGKQQAIAPLKQSMNPKFWLPDWVRALTKEKNAPEKLLQEITKRVSKDPHHEQLQEAQWLLNELARDPENTPLIRRYITREFIQGIVKAGR